MSSVRPTIRMAIASTLAQACPPHPRINQALQRLDDPGRPPKKPARKKGHPKRPPCAPIRGHPRSACLSGPVLSHRATVSDGVNPDVMPHQLSYRPATARLRPLRPHCHFRAAAFPRKRHCSHQQRPRIQRITPKIKTGPLCDILRQQGPEKRKRPPPPSGGNGLRPAKTLVGTTGFEPATP